jgi:hypothetical protein
VTVADMPCVLSKSGKRRIDAAKLASTGGAWPLDGATVELVGAMPRDGSVRQSGGDAEGLLAGLGVPVDCVSPQLRKRRLDVLADKHGARARASKEFGRSDLWPLAKHDGRAEAATFASLAEKERAMIATRTKAALTKPVASSWVALSLTACRRDEQSPGGRLCGQCAASHPRNPASRRYVASSDRQSSERTRDNHASGRTVVREVSEQRSGAGVDRGGRQRAPSGAFHVVQNGKRDNRDHPCRGRGDSPLDWSTDAGMEIPPRAHPPPQKKSAGSVAPPEKISRNFGTPTMRGKLQVQPCLLCSDLYRSGKPLDPTRRAHKRSHAPKKSYSHSITSSVIVVWCSRKKRSISRVASGPRGSVKEPAGLPPDHACPAPWISQCSKIARPPGSVWIVRV